MSPVKSIAGAKHKALVVMIGMRDIECGVLVENGARGQWIDESLQQVRIDTDDARADRMFALVSAVQKLCVSPNVPHINSVRVVVADAWLAGCSIPWSPSLQRSQLAAQYVRAQLAGAGFEISSADAFRLDDAPYGQRRMAIVFPATLLEAMDQLALRLNARLTSILPLSTAAWVLVRQGRGVHASVLAVVDAGMLMFAYGTGRSHSRIGEVTVRVTPHDAEHSVDDVYEAWQRLVLREPHLAAVERVAVLDTGQTVSVSKQQNAMLVPVELSLHLTPVGTTAGSPRLRLAAGTGNVRHALDAVVRRTITSPMRWATLAAAVLLATAVVASAVQSSKATQTLVARLNAASSVQPQAARSMAWSREELTRVHAVNAAIRELNLPIVPILRALEPPRDIRVAVLSLETTGAAAADQVSTVKIVAEARTGADMARYVAFLAERKPFAGAYLTRHEVDETTPETPYRFTVEALWSE